MDTLGTCISPSLTELMGSHTCDRMPCHHLISTVSLPNLTPSKQHLAAQAQTPNDLAEMVRRSLALLTLIQAFGWRGSRQQCPWMLPYRYVVCMGWTCYFGEGRIAGQLSTSGGSGTRGRTLARHARPGVYGPGSLLFVLETEHRETLASIRGGDHQSQLAKDYLHIKAKI